MFFSCIPKDLCKHACPTLTAVRGDGDLPGSSLAGEHPQPQRDASVAVWFPPSGPSVASPAPAPEHHQHPESQAAGAGCPGPQPAALRIAAPRRGEGKTSPATRSPLLPPGVRCPRDGPTRRFAAVAQDHQPSEASAPSQDRGKGEGKAKPRGEQQLWETRSSC